MSREEIILKNGNKASKGRVKGTPNKKTEFFHFISDNMQSLLQMQMQSALGGDLDSQRFLINKGIPTPKPGRYFAIDLHEIKTIQDVQLAQRKVTKALGDGLITIEEAEKIFEIIAQQQNTITTLEIEPRLLLLEKALKDKSPAALPPS